MMTRKHGKKARAGVAKRHMLLFMAAVVLLPSLFSSASFALTETEGNNTASEANTVAVNEQVTGNISEADSEDWYTFVLPAHGKVSFTFDYTGEGPRYDIRLFGSDSAEIVSYYIDNEVYPFTTETNRFPAGTYYVGVDGYAGNYEYGEYGLTVNYTDESSGGYEAEYNDSFGRAQQISLGEAYTGNVTMSNKNDYYKFEVTAAGEYAITYNYLGAETPPNHEVFLYDSASNELKYWMFTNQIFPFNTEAVELTPGTYYIHFRGYAGNFRFGDYQISVNLKGAAAPVTSTPDETPVTVPAPADVPAAGAPSDWAAAQVTAAIEANLVPAGLQSAYTDATTRAEFAALVVAFYETATGREIATNRSIMFTDTLDMNVYKAATIEVVTGVGDRLFDPDSNLTREQAAVMLNRLALAVDSPLTGNGQGEAFADSAAISDWAVGAVNQVRAAGIMSGVGDNTFAPQDPYTREQSIATVMRLYELVY